MGFFDVDFDFNTRVYLAVRRSKTIMLAWLKALISPIKYVYNGFKANRANNLYFLSHDGQVCYMEAALNDTFDTLRRIYITDGPYFDPEYIYTVPEEKPLALSRRSEIGTTTYPSPRWLYTRAETYDDGVSFIVHVPSSLVFDVNRMKALINEYRLPGKTYTIVTF